MLQASKDNGDVWIKAAQGGVDGDGQARFRLHGDSLVFAERHSVLAGSLTQTVMADGTVRRNGGGLARLGFDTAQTWSAHICAAAGGVSTDPTQWTGSDHGLVAAYLPTSYVGDGSAAEVAAGLARFAQLSASRVERAFPLDVAVARAPSLSLGAPAVSLLERVIEHGFVLGKDQPARFVKDHEAVTVGLQVDAVEAGVAGLSMLARVFRISQSFDDIEVLVSMSTTTAFDIEAMGKDRFVAAFQASHGGTPDIEHIEQLFLRAQSIAFTTTALIASPELRGAEVVPAAMDGLSDMDRQALTKAFPTLEGLFGTVDYCPCEHCRSVLSPAAYLVDLLQYLESSGGQTTPYDVLVDEGPIARRPDLASLALTCANTNTSLPYIDLVNEVLEGAVAGTFSSAVVDTTASSAELRAMPQNVNAEAYSLLESQRFPVEAPFSRPLALVRALCKGLEMPLAEVLEAVETSAERYALELGAPGSYSLEQPCTLEAVGFSFAELGALSGSNTRPDAMEAVNVADRVLELYGYASIAELRDGLLVGGDLPDAQLGAKRVARRLGLTYRELDQVLRTRFVNPGPWKGGLFGDRRALEVSGLGLDELREIASHEVPPPPLLEGASDGLDLPQEVQDLLDNLVVLSGPATGCDFSTTAITFADRALNSQSGLSSEAALVLLRLVLFVRLWRHLGGGLDDVDAVLSSLLEVDALLVSPVPAGGDEVRNLALWTLGYRLGLVERLRTGLELPVEARVQLAALLSTKDSEEPFESQATFDVLGPFYRELFVPPYAPDSALDHPLGRFVQDGSGQMSDYLPTLRAALRLEASDLDRLVAALGTATLSRATLVQLFRYAYFARAAELSIPELLDLEWLLTRGAALNWDTDLLRVLALRDAIRTIELEPQPLGAVLGRITDETDAPALERAVRQLAEELAQADGLYVWEDMVHQLEQHYGPEASELLEAILDGKDEWFDTVSLTPDAVALAGVAAELPGLRLEVRPGGRGEYPRETLVWTGLPTEEATTAALAALDGQPQQVELQNRLNRIRAAARQKLAALATASDSPFEREDQDVFGQLAAAVSRPTAERRSWVLANSVSPTLLRNAKRRAAYGLLSGSLSTSERLLEAILGQHDAVDSIPLDELVNKLTSSVGVLECGANSPIAVPELDPLRVDDTASLPSPTEAFRLSWFLRSPASARVRLQILGATVDELQLNGVTTTVQNGISELFVLKAGEATACHLDAHGLDVSSFEVKILGPELTPRSVAALMSCSFRSTELQYLPDPGLVVFGQLWPHLLVEQTRELLRVQRTLGLTALEFEYADFAFVELVSSDWATKRSGLQGLVRYLHYRAMEMGIGAGRGDLDPVLLAMSNAEPVAELLGAQARISPELLSDALPVGELQVEDLAVAVDRARTAGRLRTKPSDVEALEAVASNSGAFDARHKTATNLVSSLKAGLPRASWLPLAEPVFDELRQAQRDALLSYLIHARSGFNSWEEVYAYFLLDPKVEPVVQTSRIRAAIGSVQTFIQRILLNLEPGVRPDQLNAAQWAWLKRYRVWEANRKIFLYPENWLEPEFMVDKTPLFASLEGALAQSDLSDAAVDAAAGAYIRGLEEIGELDVQGLHLNPEDGSTFVLARTFAQPHKYFYRLFAQGVWEPWYPASGDIEGDHATLAFWQGRLLCLWLSVMPRPSPPYLEGGSTKGLDELSEAQLRSQTGALAPNAAMLASLNWSERTADGEWSERRSSSLVETGLTMTTAEMHGPTPVFKMRLLPTEDTLYLRFASKAAPSEGFVLGLHGRTMAVERLDLNDAIVPTDSHLHRELTRPGSLWRFEEVATRLKGEGALSIMTPLAVTALELEQQPGPYWVIPTNSPPYGEAPAELELSAEEFEERALAAALTTPLMARIAGRNLFLRSSLEVSETHLFEVRPEQAPTLTTGDDLRTAFPEGSEIEARSKSVLFDGVEVKASGKYAMDAVKVFGADSE